MEPITLEEQLKKMPAPKLGLLADVKIRIMLASLSVKIFIKEAFVAAKDKSIRRNRIFALFMLAVIVIGSTSLYAYVDDNVTRDNPLFRVKRGLEIIETAAAISPVSKIKICAKISERRLTEAIRICEKIKTEPESKDEYEKYLDETVDEVIANVDKILASEKKITDVDSLALAQLLILDTKKNEAALIGEVGSFAGPELAQKIEKDIGAAWAK